MLDLLPTPRPSKAKGRDTPKDILGPTAPTFRESSDLMGGYARVDSPSLLAYRSLCSRDPLPCLPLGSENTPRSSLLGKPR
jgi:hypothetical protein